MKFLLLVSGRTAVNYVCFKKSIVCALFLRVYYLRFNQNGYSKGSGSIECCESLYKECRHCCGYYESYIPKSNLHMLEFRLCSDETCCGHRCAERTSLSAKIRSGGVD